MLEVRILTGCRSSWRRQQGMSDHPGPVYLEQCAQSVADSDVPRGQVLLSVDGLGSASFHNLTPSFAETFHAIVQRHVEQPYLLILEDDTTVCKSLYARVTAWLSRLDPPLVFGTLYNLWGAPRVDSNGFYGGQAMLLRAERIPEFLHAAENYHELLPDQPPGWTDILFSRIAAFYLHAPIHAHVPSLVQHIGEHSGWPGGHFHQVRDFLPD